MLVFLIKRLGLALLVAFTVSVITFSLLRISGDPAVAIAGEGATASEVEYIRQQYNLDRPLPVQYLEWAGNALSGDFGRSIYLNAPVADIIGERLGATLTLGASAIAFAILLGLPLGVIAAIRPNSWIDRSALTLAVFGQALPSFWFALMLIVVFGVNLRWLPISGSESWQNFVLPAIALGYFVMPGIMRLTRTGMLEVLSSDYIRTARAKGLRVPKIIFKHALRNAVIPVVSLAAVQFGFMLGGSVVIETIFAINGIGYLAWQSIQRSDFAMMQAIVLILASFYVLLSLAADILNAALDPKIRVY